MIGISACDLEKKFQEFDIEAETVLNHQILSELFETSKEKYFLSAYNYKRTPDSLDNLYPEDVYLEAMKIMHSYGVDTNKFDRKTISIAIIEDSLAKRGDYALDEGVNRLSLKNTIPDTKSYYIPRKPPIELRIADLKTYPNLALVKEQDYEKYLAPITPMIFDKKSDIFYFVRLGLERVTFAKNENKATIGFYDIGGFLNGHGAKIHIEKINGKWRIIKRRGTWIS